MMYFYCEFNLIRLLFVYLISLYFNFSPNITPDFDLKLEVYSVMMESDLSIASTRSKIKNTIHSSISRTVGKRLAANLKDELNNTKM